MSTPAASGDAIPASEEDPLLLKSSDGEGEDDDPPKRRSSQDFASLPVRLWHVVELYWYLGLIAFGGPSVHIGILRDHLVEQHNFIEEEIFMELFALCQGLPGPTSTQLTIAIAITHAGPLGGMIAFVFWSLPGFIVLTVSGLFLYELVDPSSPPVWLVGIAPAAVSLIFKAFWGFGKKLDTLGLPIAMISCTVAVMINGDENIPKTSSQFVYPSLLVLGGITSFLDFTLNKTNPIGTYPARKSGDGEGPTAEDRRLQNKIGIPLWAGGCAFLLWLVLLVLSITLVHTGYENIYLQIFEVFYRIGSLIFGGGVVVLPMLETEVVPLGWCNDDQFFQGLGIAQSLPGPLFNFASFLGSAITSAKGGIAKGILGAITAEFALFGPGYILIFALMPLWSRIRHVAWFKAILNGLNASAIGLIGSGCFFLYAAAVTKAAHSMVFIIGGGLACFYNLPAPGVILVGIICGALFSPEFLNVGQAPYH